MTSIVDWTPAETALAAAITARHAKQYEECVTYLLNVLQYIERSEQYNAWFRLQMTARCCSFVRKICLLSAV